MGWIIFAVIVIPVLAVFVWMLLDDSFVYIDPGQQGCPRSPQPVHLPAWHEPRRMVPASQSWPGATQRS